MARVNTLLLLLTVALTVVALIDCLGTEPGRVRHFPRNAWLVLIAACPVAGAVAWFRAGRAGATGASGSSPAATSAGRAQGNAGRARTGRAGAASGAAPIGPEDDPEFVRMLAETLRDR
ncbi:PLD nuclease N-terminal domain-containing protein [Actinoplanes siamensis]|uniref:Cardiolipin synthase N-terminal domain-containing protein n=1 Tax=Actinoplanes siamensis TaxID=1223317 RepID=A0A919THT1_9ACTN|nr:PLD nuclease N-terminal domain-containing protein [Actinoplanes siamensis]GIF03697.1 hypothetical protein Asi03nite_12350 [Actinoplanes siamensis]